MRRSLVRSIRLVRIIALVARGARPDPRARIITYIAAAGLKELSQREVEAEHCEEPSERHERVRAELDRARQSHARNLGRAHEDERGDDVPDITAPRSWPRGRVAAGSRGRVAKTTGGRDREPSESDALRGDPTRHDNDIDNLDQRRTRSDDARIRSEGCRGI